jgi:hypothetical protein
MKKFSFILFLFFISCAIPEQISVKGRATKLDTVRAKETVSPVKTFDKMNPKRLSASLGSFYDDFLKTLYIALIIGIIVNSIAYFILGSLRNRELRKLGLKNNAT